MCPGTLVTWNGTGCSLQHRPGTTVYRALGDLSVYGPVAAADDLRAPCSTDPVQ